MIVKNGADCCIRRRPDGARPACALSARRTACGRAGFTGGSAAVSQTNMLRRIVHVVWEWRRLTSVEEQWHGHRGHDKFIGRGR